METDVRRAAEKPPTRAINGTANKLFPQDRAFHGWYRFVLSFPPQLVRNYIADFAIRGDDVVLDPFCGTGTTLVEAKLHSLCSEGLEANPMAHFASSVKTDWSVEPDKLRTGAREAADAARKILLGQGIRDDFPLNGTVASAAFKALGTEESKLLLSGSISPIPLHKVLVLIECLRPHHSERYFGHAMLALADTVVFGASNLHFGPEVGVGKIKTDAPVIESWLSAVERIAGDLEQVARKPGPQSTVHLADARQIGATIPSTSISAVITSPPYPNEKDYTRTTRLESVLLGFIRSRADLRSLKRNLVRSNTRGVYKGDDDDKWITTNPDITRIAEAIEARRIALGKTSGFERMYAKVAKLYFGGMARHLADMRAVLRRGAMLAYVVGDQASYLRVMIRTAKILGDVARELGYEIVRTDLFRTRFSTATKEHLREEVLVMRWNG